LIQAALAAGGPDNVTVVVADCEPAANRREAPRPAQDDPGQSRSGRC